MNRLDRKHLRWLVESCDWYLNRQARLRTTIDAIEALISELDTADNKALVRPIQMNWAVLEELYAVDLDQPHRRVLLEHQDQLDEAARAMKALALQALSEAGYALEPREDEGEDNDTA